MRLNVIQTNSSQPFSKRGAGGGLFYPCNAVKFVHLCKKSCQLNKRILQLAIPNIVTNITIPLLAMVDLGLMGHLQGEKYLGAIALGGMIFSFLFWGFGFLRMGTSGFTAQAFGRRDLGEASAVLTRGFITAILLGILLVAIQQPISWIALRFIGGSQEIESLAMSYFHIRIYTAPATLIMYALTGWFIGMQNARIPMILAISVNLLNIILSLLFIRVFGLASDGIAWANLVSQYIGLMMSLFFLRFYWKKLKDYFDFRKALSWAQFQEFIHVNKDIFIRTLCLIFTLSFFTVQSANTSDTILAVNTLLFQFFYFFSYFVDGFAYAAEALTGRYIGSEDKKNLHRAVRLLFIWAFGIATLFTIVYLGFGNMILRMLTNNSQVLDAAKPYLVWVVLVPFVTFSAFVWDGIFVGATASKAMRNSMLIITTVIFLPAYYLLEPVIGNHGLWLAMMLFMGSRGVFLSFYARKAVFGQINQRFIL